MTQKRRLKLDLHAAAVSRFAGRQGSCLPLEFYNDDSVVLSQKLLGKVLCTRIGEDVVTTGIISETEAYCGPEDKASHAYNGRRTKRTETMFKCGGIAYVYHCHMYNLLNVVVNAADVPHAVLIRGVMPLDGAEHMLRRRKRPAPIHKIGRGPGLTTIALGIDITHNAISLTGDTLWIEDRGIDIPDDFVRIGPRVGIDYAEEHAALPWRFEIVNEFWIGENVPQPPITRTQEGVRPRAIEGSQRQVSGPIVEQHPATIDPKAGRGAGKRGRVKGPIGEQQSSRKSG